ncbi:DUF5345 family protein [Kroppenstedtia pulmonis]|uniref:DUF5345 family protein n=1 Tax=Kroppenstedtia pulmonis TaxID=1380685 RepID=UPI001FE3768B|nr:DUF5345 family protein [Kroppenstedtia pulmonis]
MPDLIWFEQKVFMEQRLLRKKKWELVLFLFTALLITSGLTVLFYLEPASFMLLQIIGLIMVVAFVFIQKDRVVNR